MDPLSKTATLLILASHEEEAEDIIKSLRNRGLAVRGIFTNDPARMAELATTNPFELILCCEYDPAVDLDACLVQYRELGQDVPFLIVTDKAAESSTLIAALRAGARDLTTKGDTDRLELTVARELADFKHRRNENHLQGRLEECEKRSRDLVDATGEAVAFIQEGIHMQANPAYQELFGFSSADELDGLPLLDLIAADFQRQVRDTLRTVERRGSIVPAEIDIQCVRPDGSPLEAHLSVSQSQLEGEPCVRVMAQMQVSDAAQPTPGSVDADTGLPNRAALMEELRNRLAQTGSADASFALIHVGVDGFAKLRQDRGFSGSLAAAAKLGACIRDLAPEGAYMARAADDAYVLLVAGLQQADAEAFAGRIRQQVRLLTELDAQDDAPPCGTGLALVDSAAVSPDDLLDTVYRRYALGSSEPKTELRAAAEKAPAPPASSPSGMSPGEESKLAKRIQEAMDNNGFQLLYQPIVSLKGDSQESYDVSVQLLEDGGEPLAAKDFLDSAVKSGAMVEIDRWVIRNAVAALAAQRSNGQKVNFFVNIAEDTLQAEKLVLWVCDCLRESQARGNWLTLQIQEEHARRHAAAYARVSDGLKKVGCRIALTGFAEGPDPEALLKNLNPEYIKFRPSLGSGLADDKAIQKRLGDLTKLFRTVGVKSVVTGVEDARSLTVLWATGIDYVQGNFLQSPSPSIGQAKKS